MNEEDMLDLLGIKYKPDTKSPHFYSHLEKETTVTNSSLLKSLLSQFFKFLFQTSLYMRKINDALTEKEAAGLLKAQAEFDGLRNDSFHFSDTNIKVSRYLQQNGRGDYLLPTCTSQLPVAFLASKSYLLPITPEGNVVVV